MKTRFS